MERASIEAKKSLSLSSRFSSGDLSSELDDDEPTARTGLASVGRQDSAQNYQGLADQQQQQQRQPLQSQPQPMPPPSQPVPGAPPQPASDLSLNLRPSSRTTSAPSSPAKTRESLLQRVQSLTGAARDQSGLNQAGPQINEAIATEKSLADIDGNGQKRSLLEPVAQIECTEVSSKTVNVPVSEELLPIRMTIGSQYYTAAYRLDESNVCAEALEAILFDSFDGECILAEYQQNNYLSTAAQQKLTDLLLNRSAKSLIGAKNIQNYFVKLTDSIVRLMPNEDPNVYYIPPQSDGNTSKNPKGKLPDKWRNLTYQLRLRGILPKKKPKDRQTNVPEFSSSPTTQSTPSAIAADDPHMKSLQMLEATLAQLLVHWDATKEYRKIIRSTLNNLEDILREWPILQTDKGPYLVDYEFKNLYDQDSITNKWTTFFNALYDVKKSAINEVGREYSNMYECSNITRPEMLAGIQILLLPFIIRPTCKFKTGSGITVKPSTLESAEGFVIYCKDTESLTDKVLSRCNRYRYWHMPVQPCIVFRGPDACNIETSYVSLQEHLWEVDSPLRALDLAFKLYQVFNLHYSPDCEQVWLVVQKMVYEISKPSDKKISNVISITNVLNVKLQNKRPRTD